MIYKKKCKICGKEFETKYYQKQYCDDKHFLTCKVCGKEFEITNKVFNRSKDKWPKTCSKECNRILAKQTSIENNGTDFNNTKKAKDTRLKRYGSYESEDAKLKRKNTCLKKYNRECGINLDKAKQTKLDKYGDINYNNIEQIKQTNLERYGTENVSKCEIVKKKIIETNLKNWGVPYTFKTSNNKIKSRKTKLDKYGNEYFTNPEKANKTKLKNNNGKYQSNETTNLIKNKKKNLYGYTSWNINKAIQTNLERYGVPYYCMTEECRRLAHTPISQNNLKLKESLEKLGNKVELEYVIENLQYDLKVDNSLIEINPTFTHNSYIGPKFSEDSIGKPKDKDYHINKTKLAATNGFKCIHIFDWDNKEKIINLFCKKEYLYARKCKIKIINKEECDKFLNEYHLQNTCKGQSIKLGLYYSDKLVQVMTFGKPRYNKNYEYELLRLCTHKDYKIIGGSQKLFNYFIKTYNPISIISYCDLSKFEGNVYKKLNFELKNKTKPALHWSKYNKQITNNLLLQRGYDQLFGTNYGKGTSNQELMLKNNWLPVYDCGQAIYIYENKNI